MSLERRSAKKYAAVQLHATLQANYVLPPVTSSLVVCVLAAKCEMPAEMHLAGHQMFSFCRKFCSFLFFKLRASVALISALLALMIPIFFNQLCGSVVIFCALLLFATEII